MKRYLVVAHQTATEPHLIQRLRELGAERGGASFTLLVPATRVEHLLTWVSGEAEENARRRGASARAALEDARLEVASVLVGDELPVWAIEDELRKHPGSYDAVVLSTLPPGRSRWVEMYSHSRIDERLPLPVIHVYEGVELTMPGGRHPAVSRPPSFTRRALDWLGGGPPSARLGVPMRSAIAMVALMVVYLLGTATLALTLDQRFFINDVLALGVFSLLLVFIAREARART